MDFRQYQNVAGETAIYPGQGETAGLMYVALGLTGEAGEVANKVKKIARDANGVIDPVRAADIAEELGDVLWYVAMAATELGADLGEIAALNAAKLESRKLRGVIGGDGDQR